MIKKTFLMSRPDYTVGNLLRKLGYEEVYSGNVPNFIVFCGGSDVTPSLYSAKPEKATYSDKNIDYQDFCTVIAAKLQEIPMLGICRGLQLLHVAQGGTLIQHITGHSGNVHGLLDEEEKLIEGWEEIKVNSTHHQCVPYDELDYADEFYLSPDLTTEVVVAPKKGFLGVQYHPEYATCPKIAIDFFEELMKNKFGGIL